MNTDMESTNSKNTLKMARIITGRQFIQIRVDSGLRKAGITKFPLPKYERDTAYFQNKTSKDFGNKDN